MVSLILFFALLAAAAYGFLGRLGDWNDHFACLAQNSVQPASAVRESDRRAIPVTGRKPARTAKQLGA
jgi:hypothetical protein